MLDVESVEARTLPALAAGLVASFAGFSGAAEPFAVNAVPLRSVLHDDARVLWLGDSYAVPYASRVSGGSLLSWRVDNWTAFEMGDGPSWFHMLYSTLDPDVATIDAANGYKLYQTGPDAVVRYALPLWRLREHYRSAADSGPAPLVRYSLRDDRLAQGYQQAFGEPGGTVTVRPVFVDPPGPAVSIRGVGFTSDDGPPAAFDPRTQSRPKRLEGLDPETDEPVPPVDGQAFASSVDLLLTLDGQSGFDYELADVSPDGSSGYLFPAGAVVFQTEEGERRRGMYFSALADSSWSYLGFGSDTPSGTPGAPVKTFSREQLAHWLDATTIDPAQPIYAFYLVNVEDIGQATAAAQMEAMVDQTADAAADAGLGPVHHCIVIPWMHRIGGQIIPGRHEEQRDAAFALAASRPDVSAVSIYDFTDGHMFNGSPESRAWLADHGYDAFTYGSVTIDLSVDAGGPGGGLLDIYQSHPANPTAGAFFAHVIERAIIEACPADFRAPYGVLDLADIGGFLSGFVDARPSSDMAAPAGVFDLADLAVFVAAFNAGCGG